MSSKAARLFLKGAEKVQRYYQRQAERDLESDHPDPESRSNRIDALKMRFIINLKLQTDLKWEDRGFPDKVYLGTTDFESLGRKDPHTGRGKYKKIHKISPVAIAAEDKTFFTTRLSNLLGLPEGSIFLSEERNVRYAGEEYTLGQLWCKVNPDIIDHFSANTPWNKRNEEAYAIIIVAMEMARIIEALKNIPDDISITPPSPDEIRRQHDENPGRHPKL